MADPRVYVDVDLHEGAIVDLPDAVHRHLVVVLRRIRGDKVTLFNGRGGEYTATLETLGKKSATAKVGAFQNVSRESKLHVSLGLSISKGDRMDYGVQKAVELGVTDLQPLVTERVVVSLSQERWERKPRVQELLENLLFVLGGNPARYVCDAAAQHDPRRVR